MQNLLDQVDVGAEAAPSKPWSPNQQAVFEAVRDPDQHICIQAVAGSGKSTTIIEATKHAPGSSLFMAFNKAIAEDIRNKGPQGDVRTLNALGHSLVVANRPGAQLNARKMQDLVKKVMGEGEDSREWSYAVARACGVAKNSCVGIGSQPQASEFTQILDAYTDVPFDKLEDFGFVAREAFELSRLDTKTFDFDDQLWVPVSEGWTFPAYNTVFVDEAQDMSPIQHEMCSRLAGRGARIVAVGDRHQAIYGFRGALHDSMDQLKAKFGMLELPLSVSYRCSEAVVHAAQEFCPTIQWRDGAPKGLVEWKQRDYANCSDYARYMVLCRNNAPLFKWILRHVREHAPCQVLSSFLDSFGGFLRGFKATWTSDLSAKLDNWYERERAAAQAKNAKGKLIALQDKFDTAQLLCRQFKQTSEILDLLKTLGYSKRGPIFATIHKSKGLEHSHVYLLRPDLLGGFGEMTAEQQQQEANLHYVAITRSADTLVYGEEVR